MDSIRLDSTISHDSKNLSKDRLKNKSTTTPFCNFLKKSISEVNTLQKDANVAVKKLATGEEKDIHNTMIALQKAEVAFELVLQIQSKLIAAYDELRRMPI
jgi:flagellar hook-basal body complex protein FliE